MYRYLAIFYIYSFCGWFLESVGGILNVKKFVNRGFLIGPLCPVYGSGVVLITILLQRYVDDFLILYFMSLLICGVLEYFTSYVMEKIFHARWWDYHNTRFNINGRICLETLIPFGLVGSVIVKYLNPLIFNVLEKIPNNIKIIVLGIVSILFIIDVIVSFKVIFNFRKNVKNAENEVKDNTDEIVEKVKEEAGKFIEEKIQDFEDFKYKISLNFHETRKDARYRSVKLQKRIKEYRLKINNSSLEFKKSIQNKKRSIEEITKQVKENFSKTARAAKVSQRLLNAFPKMQIRVKPDKKKNDKDKNL